MRRLLIRPGAIGDCIVSLPALESLRTEYTEVWAAARNVPLIRFADRVRPISETGLDMLEIRGPRDSPALLESLRGFDSIVSWYGSNRAEFRTLVAQLGLPFRFFPALPKDSREHAVDFYLAQVERALPPARPVTAVPRIACPARPRRFAVIHPFSGSPDKNWPLEGFRRVAAHLGANMPVKWCAGPAEQLPDANRFDDLYELACWLAGARLYIGNDSGITHLAAAAGAPVIALFGLTDPRLWAPRGPTVHVVTPPLPDGAITRISLDQVLRVVDRMV